MWIWQQPKWPALHWQEELVQPLLRQIRLKQGLLLGKTGAFTEEFNLEASLDALVANIITSSAIEGESLNAASVRSSLAKRLGLSLDQPYPINDRSEGLAQILFDAITNLKADLNLKRLFQWHQWLFPEGKFTLLNIKVGELCGEEPMQIVSDRLDKPKIHFEAPPREVLDEEMRRFIEWFNQSHKDPLLDPFLRAGICHFWFVTIHPFEDGNGRIVRALTDLALAQADPQSIRLYAMSPVILDTRSDYYQILEQCSRGDTDITPWLVWFLQTLESALQSALDKIDRTLIKTRFWQRAENLELSTEQRKVLNRLLDGGEKGFEQGISAAQYQKVTKVSKATATRHLGDLLAKDCIEKLEGGGRSTRYQIKKIIN
jgi:Fic family protein